jgi:hypothetical protein
MYSIHRNKDEIMEKFDALHEEKRAAVLSGAEPVFPVRAYETD